MAAAKDIFIKTDMEAVPVDGDESALSVMVGNLLNNGIAYTGEGGNILIRVYSDEGRPVLEITDDGIGIAPEDRDRVFDRFYRVMGTEVSGSGLGLSIVKTIAEKHSAKISVSNGLNGRGTMFRIKF